MIKFKTFFGTMKGTTAADYLNKWLEENKTVEVIDFKYQQARFGDHSICIMYEKKTKPKNICPKCAGTGFVHSVYSETFECPICGGSGKVGVKND